jgi:hypothetical protein
MPECSSNYACPIGPKAEDQVNSQPTKPDQCRKIQDGNGVVRAKRAMCKRYKEQSKGSMYASFLTNDITPFYIKGTPLGHLGKVTLVQELSFIHSLTKVYICRSTWPNLSLFCWHELYPAGETPFGILGSP